MHILPAPKALNCTKGDRKIVYSKFVCKRGEPCSVFVYTPTIGRDVQQIITSEKRSTFDASLAMQNNFPLSVAGGRQLCVCAIFLALDIVGNSFVECSKNIFRICVCEAYYITTSPLDVKRTKKTFRVEEGLALEEVSHSLNITKFTSRNSVFSASVRIAIQFSTFISPS